MSEESNLKIWKAKKGYNVQVSRGHRPRGQSTIYTNIIDRDPRKIAQILMDLEMVDNYPIEQAIEIFRAKKRKGDWLGF